MLLETILNAMDRGYQVFLTVLRAGKAHYFSGGMKGGFHFENTIMPCISVHGMI